LVDNVDPPRLVLRAGLCQVGVERGADDYVVEAVAVDVQHRDRVAEVSAHLSSSQIVKLEEPTTGEEDHL